LLMGVWTVYFFQSYTKLFWLILNERQNAYLPKSPLPLTRPPFVSKETVQVSSIGSALGVWHLSGKHIRIMCVTNFRPHNIPRI